MTQPEATFYAALTAAALSFIGTTVVVLAQRRNTRLTSDLEQHRTEKTARLDYEYEARKRLYAELEPLFLQLSEQSERAIHRIEAAAASARARHLREESRWINDPYDYFIPMLAFHLIAPLTIVRLIQEKLTFVDLTVSSTLSERYALVKLLQRAWASDFDLAEGPPRVDYDPHHDDWEERQRQNGKIYAKQTLAAGFVDRASGALIVRDDHGARCLTFGDFHTRLQDGDPTLVRSFDPVLRLFLGFHPERRPVLWRVLLLQATLYRAFIDAAKRTDFDGTAARPATIRLFTEEEQLARFDWHPQRTDATDEEVRKHFTAVAAYVERLR
ncbi:MAG TPA: hypothetical protein VGF48_15370 [Thermoanaerobaculia bacterium]